MRPLTGPLIIVLALMMAFAIPASAADTGTVSGAVLNQNGEPVCSI